MNISPRAAVNKGQRYKLRPEDRVQIQCVGIAKLMRIPIFHIPNGVDIPHPITRQKYTEMGLEPGVPDLCLPMPFDFNERHYSGLYVECKAIYRDAEGKKKGQGRVSKEQELWHDRLRSWGYRVEIIFESIAFENLMFQCYPSFAKRFAHLK